MLQPSLMSCMQACSVSHVLWSQSVQEAAAAEAAAAVAEAKRAVDLAASAAELQRRGDDLQARLRPQQTLISTVSCPHIRMFGEERASGEAVR